MTELTWLISLLLNEKLPNELKTLVADRIKDVEANLQQSPKPRTQWTPQDTHNPEDPIAVTQAAAQALASREAAIRGAGKVEAGRSSPRKF